MCSQFIINQTAGAKIFTKFVPIQKDLLFELQTSDCADAADDEYQEKNLFVTVAHVLYMYLN